MFQLYECYQIQTWSFITLSIAEGEALIIILFIYLVFYVKPSTVSVIW